VIAARALAWATTLPPVAPEWLAERLYRFHSLPRGDRKLDPPDTDLLARSGGWSVDHRARGPWLGLGRRAVRAPWKLYISPHPARLAEVALTALPVLARTGATSAKLGRVPETLLRPDRFVAYFPDFPSLRHAADELVSMLQGIAAHGAPFTGQLDSVGLLSFGCDPAPDPDTGMAISWRQLVTRRLALPLVRAGKRGLGPKAAIRHALRSLPAHGIDPLRFAPLVATLPGSARTLWKGG
jgi:hypothetical protein